MPNERQLLVVFRRNEMKQAGLKAECLHTWYLTEKLKLFFHQLNSKNSVQFYLFKTIYSIETVSYRLLQRMARVDKN